MSDLNIKAGSSFGNWAIKKYQKYVSSALADDRDYSCKYTPSCSHYGQDAVKEYGIVEGSVMAFMRMMRCHKTTEGGYDPVIPKKDRDKVPDFIPAHMHYKYKTAKEIFEFPSKRHVITTDECQHHHHTNEVKEEEPKGVKGKIGHAIKSGVQATTAFLGGLAGAGLFAVIGAPLGTYLGHKAGNNKIDDVNAAIARKYSPESVYGFAKIENSFAKPAYKINQFVENHTGSKIAARVAGTMVGGPSGLILGIIRGAKKGFETGAQYGRLFGKTLTSSPKKTPVATILEEVNMNEVSNFFDNMKSFKVGGTAITPVKRQLTVPANIAFLESAKKSIDANMFSVKAPQVIDILKRKASEGVKVRVLTDLSGETEKFLDANKKMISDLKAAGIEVHSYPKVRSFNQFNHTKMVVIDDRAAMIGSRNWGHSFGNDIDHDAVFFMTGDTVNEARKFFEHDWQISGGTPKEISHEDLSPNVRILGNEPMKDDLTDEIASNIKNAGKTIDVSMAWFSDRLMMKSLKSAVDRGVKVRVLLANSDKNVHAYNYLKKAGAEVKVYSPPDENARSYFHEKTMIFDDETVISGSTDLTPQGLYLNRELNIEISDKELATYMKEEFNHDWTKLSTPKPDFDPYHDKKFEKERVITIADRALEVSERLPGSLQKAGMKLASLLSLVGRKFSSPDFGG